MNRVLPDDHLNPIRSLARAYPKGRGVGNTPSVSASTLSEVEQALEQYSNSVLDADLSDYSKDVYINHADNFVRWLKGDFVPGARVNPYRLKRNKDLPVHAFNPEAIEE